MKTRYALLATLGLGLGLILVLLWALGGPSVVHADPGVLCVAPGGTGCGGPCGDCYASVQAAVDAAGTGDEIRIASGVYTGVQTREGTTQVVIITKTLTLSGGYTTTNWTTSDPVANPTTLDAERQGRVMYITADVNPTVEGLRITGGDGSTGGDDNGGGIAIQEATAIIRHNVISDNVGGRLLTVGGDGGGIYVITSTSPVLIYSNTIQANVGYSGTLASPTVAGGGLGGGIAVFASSAIITGNQILDNTAAQTDIPSSAARGYGGGIGSVFADTLTIEDNWIQGNLGVASGLRGFGGGIMSYGTPVLNIADNTVIENTAIISGADAGGGGMWLSDANAMTLTGNWVISNTAGVTITANPSYPNPWAGGGGIRIYGGSTANDILTMQDNHLIGNVTARTMTTSGASSMGHAEGGGLIANCITTTLIISNEVRGNMAVENLSLSGSGGWGGRPAGGGMYLSENDTVTLSGNEVRDNVAAKQQAVNGVSSGSEGGGIALINVENATINNNTVSTNTAVVTGNITSNTGEDYYPQGGGIMVGCWDNPNCTLSLAGNNISNNTAAYTVTVSGNDARGGANGGGVKLDRVAAATVISNQASGNVALQSGTATDSGSRVYANGGGLNLGEIPTATLRMNWIGDNAGAGGTTLLGGATEGGAGGGGISLWRSTALLQSNVISGNTSNLDGDGWGGGVDASESTVTMEANTILGNRMNPTYSGGSGGVWVWESALTSVNDVFARNYDGIGGGDNGSASTLTLINDTLYDNDHVGVWVGDSSRAYITNTIVYSHNNGLDRGGSATLIGNYNLLSNTVNYAGGVVPGTHDITDEDPLFLDAPNDDFHIASDSPAVDVGTSVGAPSVDFEDDPRPQGPGVDIGADEVAWGINYLPIIMKNY